MDKASTLKQVDVEVEADLCDCNRFYQRQLLVWVSWVAVLDGLCQRLQLFFGIRDCGVGILSSFASEGIYGLNDLVLVRIIFKELQQLVVVEFGAFSERVLEGVNATE